MTTYEGSSKCRLCGHPILESVYHGPIRAGTPGKLSSQEYRVLRCRHCDVGFLHPVPEIDYHFDQYRHEYNNSTEVDSFFRSYDASHVRHLEYLRDMTLRGTTVVDVGCGGGSFLDLVKGFAARTIAVEPFQGYHASLRERGHQCYASMGEALSREGTAKADLAMSLQVIEHVDSPIDHLRDIGAMLRPGGILLLATPNHDDFLMAYGPAEYQTFFYRTSHPWCFSLRSLRWLAQHFNFQVLKDFTTQRYDLSNTLLWMRDRTPSGNHQLPVLDDRINAAWQSFLCSTGYGDALYALWQKPEG